MLPNLNFIKTMLNGVLLKFKVVDEKIEQTGAQANAYTDNAVAHLATTEYVDARDYEQQDRLHGELNQMVGFDKRGDACVYDMNLGIKSPNGTTWDLEVSDDGVLSATKRNSIRSIIDDSATIYKNIFATSIRDYAFYSRLSLVKAEFPEVVTIGANAFHNCSKLESAYFPLLTEIGNYAFYYCGALSDIYCPNITSIGEYAFTNCSALTETPDLSKLTFINYHAFQNCTSLTTVVLPKVTEIYNGAFDGCTSLKIIDCYELKELESGFNDCASLTTIILRNAKKVCDYTTSSGFRGTPIAEGAGYIYVPAALFDSYISHNWWSRYAGQIRTIEDYPEITGGGG